MDLTQSRIPKPGSFTKIPLPSSIRPMLQNNAMKSTRPTSFLGLRPPSLSRFSLKKSLSGDKICEVLNSKFQTSALKPSFLVGPKDDKRKSLKKPNKLKENLARSETFIRDVETRSPVVECKSISSLFDPTELLMNSTPEKESPYRTHDIATSEMFGLPDILDDLQDSLQPKSRLSFGLDLTETTLDCSIELVDVSIGSSSLPPQRTVSSPSYRRNSFEMDESLGILTPDQMKEFLDSATGNTSNLDLPLSISGGKFAMHHMRIDQTPSPEDLPLDPVGVKSDIDMVCQVNLAQHINAEHSQTDTDPKTDLLNKSTASVSKISTSFVTSVTSVTSLDTGYQGDGEMSRPASRGAGDHSPFNGANRKLAHVSKQPSFNQNIPIRRADPMTDSDFFTESDADDVFNRGDRRAQVIDGQLYGQTLNPTAEVFITEQPQMVDSCMESSGIFTDVENRCDDDLSQRRPSDPNDIDMSPDVSTDTVKSNYQNNNYQKGFTDLNESESYHTAEKALSSEESCDATKLQNQVETMEEDSKINCTQSVQKFTSTRKYAWSSPVKNDILSQQSKDGSRKITSNSRSNMLIKSTRKIGELNSPTNNSSPPILSPTLRKSAPATNKWDAIVNKIANNKAQLNKKNYSEVKSKVSTGVVLNRRSPPVSSGLSALKQVHHGSTKSVGNIGRGGSSGGCNSSGNTSGLVSPQDKQRTIVQTSTKRARSYDKGSGRSSLSDLSTSGGGLSKTPLRAAKKRDVRNLTISPSDLGPPAKAHQSLNGTSSRLKLQQQHSVNSSQKRTPPKVATKKTSPLKSQEKTPLKDQKQQNGVQNNCKNFNNGPPSPCGIINGRDSYGIPADATTPNNNNSISTPEKNKKTTQTESGLKPKIKDTRGVEALGVLLQYLVYDLDGFSAPKFKKESEKAHNNLTKTMLLLEEAKSFCQELQDQLNDKESYYFTREQELQTLHSCELNKAENSLSEFKTNAEKQIEILEEQVRSVKVENQNRFESFQNEVVAKLGLKDIELEASKQKEKELSEKISQLQNSEIQLREKIHAAELNYSERLQSAAQKEKDLIDQVNSLNKDFEDLRKKYQNREKDLEEKLNLTQDEVSVLRHSSQSNQNSPRNSSSGSSSYYEGNQRLQYNEIESLRCVLELKQKEISKITKQNQELIRELEETQNMTCKISTLENRVEDLQTKLTLKCEEEKNLREKYDHLKRAHNHEAQVHTRLSFNNEELKYQLKQRSEQIHLLEEQLRQTLSTSKISINSQDTADFCLHKNSSLMSLNHMESNVSPPASPIIKAVIKKHDSVSWVLEMDDETPEVAASKVVRRAGSFRSVTERSPSIRHRYEQNRSCPNPLQQSASATSVSARHSIETTDIPSPAHARIRSKSVSVKSPEPKKFARQNSTGSRKLEIVSGPICTSSPYVRSSSMRCRKSVSVSPTQQHKKLTDEFESDTDMYAREDVHLITCDTSALNSGEKLEMGSLPTHSSVHDLKCLKKCQEIQESAGEAMVSGTNSEDEGCSASSEDVCLSSSTGLSSSSTSSIDRKHLSIEEVLLLDKITKSLNGSPMEVSWSDDPEHYAPESVV